MTDNPSFTRHGRRRWIAAGAFALTPVLILVLHFGWVVSANAFFDGKWSGPYNLVKPAYSSILWSIYILGACTILGIGAIVWLGIRYRLKWPRTAIAGVVGYVLACILYGWVMLRMAGLLVFGFYPEREISRQNAYGNTYIILTGQPAFFDGSYFLLVECQSVWRCKTIEKFKSPDYYQQPTLELDDQTQTAQLRLELFSP